MNIKMLNLISNTTNTVLHIRKLRSNKNIFFGVYLTGLPALQ